MRDRAGGGSGGAAPRPEARRGTPPIKWGARGSAQPPDAPADRKGSGRPVWEDLLSSDDLAALEQTGWHNSPDVLIVGGGAIGLACAVMCNRAGLSTLLVERGRLAWGASGRAAGGLSPDAHPELGPEWREVAHESLRMHYELDASWDYGVRTMDLRVGPELILPKQAHVDPLRMCATFARHAGAIATGVEARGFDGSTVRTSAGDVRPAHVVWAAGSGPRELRVEQTWVKGHLIATEPASFSFDGIAAPLGVQSLVLQLPSGHLVAGGTKEMVERADVDEDVVAQVTQEMVKICPDAADLRVTHRWTCFRPRLANELPIVDRFPGASNVWLAVGFYSTGILMAPVVGKIVADSLLDARSGTDALRTPFRLRDEG